MIEKGGGIGSISLKPAKPRVSLHGRIKSQNYLKILSNQIHPMFVELFPEGNAIFQDDNAPIDTAKIVSE